MIITEDLTKYFKEFPAVKGVNLHVRAGEVLALLGPNGAGKTTTVRMLTTVLRPTRGWARVAGYHVLKDDVAVRQSVGVLTEHHGLYQRMRVTEYLDFFGQLYDLSSAQREERIAELLEKFGLDEAMERRIGEFSKGMRQKLSLARSLLHSPPVLLLDEPTSAMDPESARLVRNAIKKLRSEDRSIVVCTHNLSEAEDLADKIAIIRQGEIIAQGTPGELKRQLLGPGEYVVHIREALDGKSLSLPTGVEVTAQGRDWFRYRTSSPDEHNPRVVKGLLGQDYSIVKLEEVQRSLESVYLQAVSR